MKQTKISVFWQCIHSCLLCSNVVDIFSVEMCTVLKLWNSTIRLKFLNCKTLNSLSIFSSELHLIQFLSHLTNPKVKYSFKNNYVPANFLENSINRKEEDQIHAFTWIKTDRTLILHTTSAAWSSSVNPAPDHLAGM